MKKYLILIPFILFISFDSIAVSKKSKSSKFKEPQFQKHCGWYESPNPGQETLTDAKGKWIIADPAGHKAQGEWPPKFSSQQLVSKANSGFEYGCVCAEIWVNKDTKEVLEIKSSKAEEPAVCRKNKKLKEPKIP